MMQSESGTTSMAPSEVSFHLAGPSSLSQSLPGFFAQASRFLPSKRMTASLGAGALRVGDIFKVFRSGTASAFAGMKLTGFSTFFAGAGAGASSAASKARVDANATRTQRNHFIVYSGKG